MTRYWIDLIFIIILMGAAMTIGLAATTAGPGINPDGFVYISMAQNIEQGRGFVANFAEPFEPAPTKPVTLFAPGYSILTALLVGGGVSPVQAARLVSVFSFAGLTAATYWLTLTLAARPAALVAGLTTLLLMPLVRTASFALSEAAFMLFSILSLAGLLQYLKTAERSRRWLIFAAVLLGMATATRYLGILWLAAGGVTLFLAAAAHRNWKKAIIDSVLFGLVSLLFVLPWIIRNYLLVGYATGKDRQEGAHLAFSENLNLFIRALSGDLIPSVHLGVRGWLASVPLYGWLLFLLVVMVAGYALWRLLGGFYGLRRLAGPRAIKLNWSKIRLGSVVSGYAIFYLAMLLVFSVSTQFPAYDWPRYLAPVYPLLISIGVSIWFGLLVWVMGRPASSRLWPAMLLSALLWLLPYGLQTAGFIPAAAQGQNFTAIEWRQNPVIENLAVMVTASDELYSDQPYVVALSLGRPVRHLPETSQSHRLPELIDRPHTEGDGVQYVAVFKGALAQFDPYFAKRMTAADMAQLAAQRDDIQLVLNLPEGDIYRLGALPGNLANQPTQ